MSTTDQGYEVRIKKLTTQSSNPTRERRAMSETRRIRRGGDRSLAGNGAQGPDQDQTLSGHRPLPTPGPPEAVIHTVKSQGPAQGQGRDRTAGQRNGSRSRSRS